MAQKQYDIPREVRRIVITLESAGHEARLVGGCVRDLLRNMRPKDWDIATNATPEQIQELFEHTYYENQFGTVGVVNDETEDVTIKNVEVTTYRLESTYSDSRHPDTIVFSNNLEDDLKRRDFTINAIALALPDTLIDPHGGVLDIEKGVIRAVGAPTERFKEDALRMMRAVRFAAEFDFEIEKATAKAIKKEAQQIDKIARERMRDELSLIIMSSYPRHGFEIMHAFGLLTYIMPELEEGIGIDQNQAHSFDVWEHSLRSLQAAADKGWGLELRLAALLHDIAKPRTRKHDKKKNDWSFHGHEVIGAHMTRDIMRRLRFPNAVAQKVIKLVRWHMFFSDTDLITLSAVRRMIANVGKDSIWHLMDLRVADRVGTGRPKEKPYRLRKYQAMVEEALRDPVSVGMLEVDGSSIMHHTNAPSGPRIGWVLHALLDEVFDDPKKNTESYLLERAQKLLELPDDKLKKQGEAGMQKKEKEEAREIEQIRKRYWVE